MHLRPILPVLFIIAGMGLSACAPFVSALTELIRTPTRAVEATGPATPLVTTTGTPTPSPTEAGSATLPPVTVTRRPTITAAVTGSESGAGATVRIPSLTPIPVPASRKSPVPPPCDAYQFTTDLTYPDGSVVAPGAVFTKMWRIKNVGTCPWTTDYSIVFTEGDRMNGPGSVPLPASVPPGGKINVAVALRAPASEGHYRGYWVVRNASGVKLGKRGFFADIKVSSSRNAPVYDFYSNYCSAAWESAAGIVVCPSVASDPRGAVQLQFSPLLENGEQEDDPGLLTVPQTMPDGYIKGTYPEIRIRAGDQLVSRVDCEGGYNSCDTVVGINYMIGSGPETNLWTWDEKYDGALTLLAIDLTPLAGYDVRFSFTVHADGSPKQDHVQWLSPRIIRQALPTPPATPVESPTASPTP